MKTKIIFVILWIIVGSHLNLFGQSFNKTAVMKRLNNIKIGLCILFFLFIIFFTNSCFTPSCFCQKERGCLTVSAIRWENHTDIIATKTFYFSNEWDKNDSIRLFKQSLPQDGSVYFVEHFDSLEYYDKTGEVSKQEIAKYVKLKYSCVCAE
jgi:hypothetical protein